MPRPVDPDLADRIVQAAADLLEKKGIDGVTMRAVAAEAQCSATTIYQRFKNKDELLDHAVVRGLEWFNAIQVELPENTAGLERLRATSHSYVEWGIKNPAMYRLIFEQRLPKPAAGAELKRRRRGWELQRDMLTELLAERPLGAPPVDVDTAADVVFV
ncbi:MAG TPA: TetR/AcrR family transcriptional regulator, partial [Coriobacteriia bacterium]|nr:TetR/AcrR family transcriptional regulator [Coriobacteriia bacterium]